MKKITHKEYIVKVEKMHPNIEVLERYINAHTKILHKCKTCGHEWMSKPSSILVGYGCAKCAKVKKLTHDEYKKKVEETSSNIEVVEEYINMCTKILHKCKICGHEWNAKPSDIVTGHGCPICSKRAIGNSPEYKNSIWASEYKKYFSRYMTEEQMKKYMPHSDKKIEVKCPNCNKRKEISPNTLLRNGLGCICGDGISYPNKFVYFLLKQLNIEIKLEFSPKWANKKKYDIYIPSLNCIIENHGKQHYEDGYGMYSTTYETQKRNDQYKESLARNNGINNYIIIDCRYSNKDWIRQSVVNSGLLNIIGSTESEINWHNCDEFATSNLVKVASELWNSGMCTIQIRDKMKLSKSSINNYLNKGAKLLMCNYTGELSRQRTREYRNKTKSLNRKGV